MKVAGFADARSDFNSLPTVKLSVARFDQASAAVLRAILTIHGATLVSVFSFFRSSVATSANFES